MPSENDVKSLFKSKTFWFNVLTGVGAIVGAGVLPPSLMLYAPTIMAVVNIGLRWVTTQPVSINP